MELYAKLKLHTGESLEMKIEPSQIISGGYDLSFLNGRVFTVRKEMSLEKIVEMVEEDLAESE